MSPPGRHLFLSKEIRVFTYNVLARRDGLIGLRLTTPRPASSTLSHLTRLFGFISYTQSQLASIHQLSHPPPVCIIDRIDPALQWPLSAPAHPDNLRHLQDIFGYFFQNVWAIQKLPLDPGQSHSLTCMVITSLRELFLSFLPLLYLLLTQGLLPPPTSPLPKLRDIVSSPLALLHPRNLSIRSSTRSPKFTAMIHLMGRALFAKPSS